MKKLFYITMLYGVLLSDQIIPKDFSYLKAKMPKFDATLIDIHLKLYEGYVAQVNFIDSNMDKTEDPFLLQSLRKQYGFEYDGMSLHELYFGQLGGNGKTPNKKRVLDRIETTFGSFENFRSKVLSFAKTRGIGWIILFGNIDGGDLKLSWVADHEKGFLSGWVPVCVIDLWEHAYLSQFGLDKTNYIDLLFEYMDWSVINTRYIEGCKTIKNNYKEIKKKF